MTHGHVTTIRFEQETCQIQRHPRRMPPRWHLSPSHALAPRATSSTPQSALPHVAPTKTDPLSPTPRVDPRLGVDVDRATGMTHQEYRTKMGQLLAARDRGTTTAAAAAASAGAPGSSPSASPAGPQAGLDEAYALVARELRLARTGDRNGTGHGSGTGGGAHHPLGTAAGSRPASSSRLAGGGAGGALSGGGDGDRLGSTSAAPSGMDAFSLSVGGGGGRSGGGNPAPFLTWGGRYSRWRAPVTGDRSWGQGTRAGTTISGDSDAGAWSVREGSVTGWGSGGVGGGVASGNGVDSKVGAISVLFFLYCGLLLLLKGLGFLPGMVLIGSAVSFT